MGSRQLEILIILLHNFRLAPRFLKQSSILSFIIIIIYCGETDVIVLFSFGGCYEISVDRSKKIIYRQQGKPRDWASNEHVKDQSYELMTNNVERRLSVEGEQTRFLGIE